ncbi:MAG: SufE family protein [Thermoleophilia bacterium]|nr:SufE family protein [Thermoleophilia bacterium]
MPREMKLPLLLDYANGLPPLPEGFDSSELQRVEECQTPFFVAAEVSQGQVRLFFDAPPEAPTTRGYAGVLHTGLDGSSVDEVLGTPADFFVGMGLAELISPLRLRGMGAILAGIKRQVAAATA